MPINKTKQNKQLPREHWLVLLSPFPLGYSEPLATRKKLPEFRDINSAVGGWLQHMGLTITYVLSSSGVRQFFLTSFRLSLIHTSILSALLNVMTAWT